MGKEGAQRAGQAAKGGLTAELPKTASLHAPSAELMLESGTFTQCKNQKGCFADGNPSSPSNRVGPGPRRSVSHPRSWISVSANLPNGEPTALGHLFRGT